MRVKERIVFLFDPLTPTLSPFRGRFFGSLRAKEHLLGPNSVQKFL